MNNEKQSTPAPAVEARNINKSFQLGRQRIQALRNLNLKVNAGEFVAVMGASGSGKSTLLHLLAGLTAPDSGEIYVGGDVLSGMSDGALSRFRRRRVGLVFQSFNLIPTLTARDNIMLPLLLDGAKQEKLALAQEITASLGLQDRLSHHPDALSGGEQQRVAIARALAIKPDILLADEPTGNLDSIASRKLGQALSEINQRHQTAILLVTHDAWVASWAQRILFLRDGSIIEEFLPHDMMAAEEISARYLNLMQAG